MVKLLENQNYTISIMDNCSKLDEVYRLTHDTLTEAGDIPPQKEGKIVSFPEIDRIPQTTIIIAEQNDRIVGTISFTLDSENGLHVSKWFKKETEQLRKITSGRLGAFWRIATQNNYRKSRALVLDLMDCAFTVARNEKCDFGLLVSTYRHIRLYQRFIGAQILAQRKSSLDKNFQIDTAMMIFNIEEGWKTFNEKNRRYLNRNPN